jgi:hypothetical protein
MSVFTNPASGAAEQASAYVAAVLDLLGSEEPMTVLRATPAAVRRAIDGLSPAELLKPERAGKWSIGQVLQHLADSDLVWGWRLRLILAQDRPNLTGYDQDQWAQRLRYAESDPADSLEMFGVLRRSSSAHRLRTCSASASTPSGARRRWSTSAGSMPVTICCTCARSIGSARRSPDADCLGSAFRCRKP